MHKFIKAGRLAAKVNAAGETGRYLPYTKKKNNTCSLSNFNPFSACLLQNYMNPLKLVLTPQDMEAIFINLEVTTPTLA